MDKTTRLSTMFYCYCKTEGCETDGQRTRIPIDELEPIEASQPTRVHMLNLMPKRAIKCEKCGQTHEYSPETDYVRALARPS